MQVPRAAMERAQESFGRCELGAERRLRRRVTVGAQLASHAGDTAANEGAYRLLGNAQATAALAAQTPGDWWAVEDSTTLFSAHGVVEALGDWGGKAPARGRGFIVHSVLMRVADSGRTRGLREQSRWQVRCSSSLSPRGRGLG